jgi:hypothetical protein
VTSNAPKKRTLANEALKLKALIAAEECHNSGKAVRSSSPMIKSPEDDAMDLDTDEEMEDEDMDIDYIIYYIGNS